MNVCFVIGKIVSEIKFDFILNIGQEESPIFPLNQFYGELELRYGIDLDSYNLGIVVGGTYLGNNESGEGDSVIKLERGYLVSFKLENEFIFTPDFTVGFDLYLNLHLNLHLHFDLYLHLHSQFHWYMLFHLMHYFELNSFHHCS